MKLILTPNFLIIIGTVFMTASIIFMFIEHQISTDMLLGLFFGAIVLGQGLRLKKIRK